MLARCIRGYSQLTFVLALLAAFLILAMSVWITIDVLLRNLFGIGKPWFFDLSEYTLVWVTFLGAPWVLLQDRHVRIEILTDALPVAAQRWIGVVVSAMGIIVCLVMFWRTSIAAMDYFNKDVMMPRIWRIPRIWPYAIVPIASLLLAVAFAIRLNRYLTLGDPEATFKQNASGTHADTTNGH